MNQKMNPQQILAAALALSTTKVAATRKKLGEVLIKREQEILALCVGMVADVAVFLDGPAGVAKTMTAELFVDTIKDATHFTMLVPGMATPDDMFVEGMTIVKSQTPEGEVTKINKTLGRAATATGVILDEIWKAEDNPPVLNALLDLLLSKGIRHEGKKHADKACIVVAISNEEPDPDGKYMAHWARCVLRLYVKHLEGSDLDRMFDAQIEYEINGRGLIQPQNPLTVEEVHFLQQARAHVVVPQEMQDTVKQVIADLNDQDAGFGWLITDNRRYGLILRSLQAHALINGRSTVSSADLTILRWMLWNTPEQIGAVDAMIDPLCRTPFGECRELVDELLASGGIVDQVCLGSGQQAANALTQVNACKGTLTDKVKALLGAEADKVQGWIKSLDSLVGVIAQGFGGSINKTAAKAAYDAVKAALN